MRVISLPTSTDASPSIITGTFSSCAATTVTVLVPALYPDNEAVIVTSPSETPWTTPSTTVALPSSLDTQVTPATVDVRVISLPTSTELSPEIEIVSLRRVTKSIFSVSISIFSTAFAIL